MNAKNGDGKDERREQQMKLRDHPDGHAASTAETFRYSALLIRLVLGLFERGGRLVGCPAAPRRLVTVATGAR
jgi:hypothetical protein